MDNGTQAVGSSACNPIDLTVEEEHPDAPKIRRQVEYYFSDENLPQDLHLLQCCGGRQNLPVSISRIRGFKKMRQFKNKKLVVDALRKSAFLQVSADGKHITRKVPLAGPCLLDEADHDGEIAFDPRTQKPVAHPIALLPQKKKEYPPGVTKNMLKPTGFEETFVEGPITPAEAEEEMAMYDPDKPFVERIEIAIQRFKSKKRMHEMYAKVFNKWMRFGGVEMSPRMFGALSKQDMAEMDAEQIAKALAIHHIPWDRQDPKHWEVDFEGVGKAFLSSYYPLHFGYDPRQITIACQVLRSFYNYLLFHNVCDEYRSSLIFSRAFCDQAEVELVKSSRLGLALPGAFNTAGSTAYGGSHADTSLIGQHWAKDATWNDGFDVGMRLEEAKVTFKTAIAMLGTDEQYDIVEGKDGKDGLSSITVLSSEYVDIEVTSVEYATEEIKALYAKHNETLKRKLLLQPLGKLVCKSWNKEDFDEYDLPKVKYPKGKLPKTDIGKVYEFWIEDEVLMDCFEGAKIEAKVMTLSCGITIMDIVNVVHPSFYEWLPNELWMERHPREFKLLKKSLEGLDEEDLVEINGQDGGGEEIGE
ncbi:Argonaute siRNA chaperone complex subunit Arb1-domain-containing protein [Clohesyomyces aquaticus]|uniref:Argonaute siRNA chaperone complex subunit Arb1-domain-containing protein n=1 Tax=Clohesyomyces aquaticus TaxID=1231657 RepID=A0A1Y1ZHF3_9PLEO|nr:Argonaute siRNA chaperone complex subunit Arb1-domain-containing protein [Clohesyomyces aquaticus]